MSMDKRKASGQAGEDKAVNYLRKNGYRVLSRNVRNRFGEIDVVALDKGVICFVEVRTRQNPLEKEEALASIGPKKQERLSRAALNFLKEKNCAGHRARFDVVVIAGNEDIVLLKDAFPVIEKYR